MRHLSSQVQQKDGNNCFPSLLCCFPSLLCSAGKSITGPKISQLSPLSSLNDTTAPNECEPGIGMLVIKLQTPEQNTVHSPNDVPIPLYPRVAARITTVRMTARINSKQQAFDRAFLWYLAALLNSRSAPRVSVLVFSTFSWILSRSSPCSLTMCATSLNSSFNSVTPCSMFRISASRSTINESWKSTSSCDASLNSC